MQTTTKSKNSVDVDESTQETISTFQCFSVDERETEVTAVLKQIYESRKKMISIGFKI